MEVGSCRERDLKCRLSRKHAVALSLPALACTQAAKGVADPRELQKEEKKLDSMEKQLSGLQVGMEGRRAQGTGCGVCILRDRRHG